MQQNENSFFGGVFWQHLLNMDGNGVLGQLEIENPRKFEDWYQKFYRKNLEIYEFEKSKIYFAN